MLGLLAWALSVGVPLGGSKLAHASLRQRVAASSSSSINIAKPPAGLGPSTENPKAFSVNRVAPTRGGSKLTSIASVASTAIREGTLIENFEGTSSLDNFAANGFDLEPPDQGLCTSIFNFGLGNKEVVTDVINLVYNLYQTNGTPIATRVPMYFLFQESPNEFLSDPRCVYDTATGYTFFTALAIDPSGTSSHFDVTVVDPLGFLHPNRFDTTDPSGTSCPCFGDQPLLGIDSQNVYVSINEFPIAGGSTYNGADIFAISKSQLEAVVTPNYVEYSHIADNGALIETLQPAITTSSSSVEYFMHSFVVDSSGFNTSEDHRLGIFALTTPGLVSTGGTPTLIGPTIVSTETYVQPQVAVNPNGFVLNANDDRLQQLQYKSGHLFAALTSTVIVGSNPHDGLDWFNVAVSTSGSKIKASVSHQGVVASAGTDLLYPAIVSGPDGNMDMAFSMTSPSMNPSTGWVFFNNGGTHFGPINLAATGSGPDTGFTCTDPVTAFVCRWGDYSWAAIDPVTGDIWLAAEYIPSSANASPDGFVNWGTRVYEVKE